MTTVIVCGNGPSLNETPLEALKAKGHIMFGVNRVHLLYPKRPWRPDHWVIMDRSNWSQTDADITLHLEQGYPCWVREDLCVHRPFYTHPNLRIVRQCEHIDMEHSPTMDWHFDDDEKPVCQQAGSAPGAVQIALQNLSEVTRIILVGCDMNFRGNEVNHFDPKYVDPDMLTIRKAIIATENLNHIWSVARRHCEKVGVELLNGTIGGQLAVLPRIDITTVV